MTKEQNNQKIGRKLRDLRVAVGFSKYQVAKIINKNRGIYRSIEDGSSTIDVITLKKLCTLYDVTPNDIIWPDTERDLDLCIF